MTSRKEFDVSIIMSVYDESEQLIFESVRSMINQTFSRFEFIIVNDNPESKRINNILNRISNLDTRIKVLTNETNIGLAKSLNKAITASKFDYIARMDADDISLKDRLEKQVHAFKINDNLDIVGTDYALIGEQGEAIEQKHFLAISDLDIKEYLQFDSPICHPSVMMKKSKYLELGCYNPLPSAQDYDLWVRANKNGMTFYNIPEVLIHYRVRSDGISHTNLLRQFLCTEYSRKKLASSENFVLEELKDYLEDNGANDSTKVDNFKKDTRVFLKFLHNIKSTSSIKPFIQTLLNLAVNAPFRRWLKNWFRLFLLRRKLAQSSLT
ncbi:hypothetical protein AOC36_08415 [Erysipelothrix larvae]|uniref:Glycosyltransferase 2-like domain-containing protein n=1 Tax=Erysipelothrix larvae TaxID=1514105 RepID=A0A120JTU7_9FIRM|nr:glycosyltransferase [Erysipelothrix larvae]AMC94008.1 hypothetical protein AOC36_08415 [Erysipelothrix larvae]